jgi:hypothetical protein
MIWAHATIEHPCPICGKTDWCTFGDRAVLCQRVESERPDPKGGWYHNYGSGKAQRFMLPPSKQSPAHINCASIITAWKSFNRNLSQWSESLGVSVNSLSSLDCVWSSINNAWAFPMSDGMGGYIGIRLRNADGFKWAVTGSRQGIFIPNGTKIEPRICYLPEGPTDTAALLTLGLFAIGRPNCLGGGEFIKEALKRLGIYRVVIVSDNDQIKQDGKRPGLEGAIKLKKFLGLASVIWIPPSPIKDVREFLNKGGTAQMIEAEIKNKVWSKS